MNSPSDRDLDVVDANHASRLSAILIWVIAAAVVCAAATWPRWHSTTSVVATNSSGSTTPAGNSGATPSAALEPSSPSNVTSVPVAAAVPGSSPTGNTTTLINTPANTLANTPASNGAAATTPRTRPATPSHIGELNVPAAVEDWQHLNDKQRAALAPFVDEWARLPDSQKRKWLAIATVYPRMSPDEQQRLHARMLRWVQMTPDERTIARENYQMSRVLPPGARQQAWRAYEALTPAQKAKLAAAERSRRRKLVVSAVPGPHAPLSARAVDKNAPAAASNPLSTEKLVPLGSVNPGGAGANQSAAASSPAVRSDGKTVAKGAKGLIGNLDVDSSDRP